MPEVRWGREVASRFIRDRRRKVFVGAVVAALAVLVAARSIAHDSDDGMDPRAAQREYLRFVSAYITDYARTYHRPAFALDSVIAHLDSAHGALFRRYLTDLWGHPVAYSWAESSFTLRSFADGGGSAPRHDFPAAWKQEGCDRRDKRQTGGGFFGGECGRLTYLSYRKHTISEDYWWPTEVLSSGRFVHGGWQPFGTDGPLGPGR